MHIPFCYLRGQRSGTWVKNYAREIRLRERRGASCKVAAKQRPWGLSSHEDGRHGCHGQLSRSTVTGVIGGAGASHHLQIQETGLVPLGFAQDRIACVWGEAHISWLRAGPPPPHTHTYATRHHNATASHARVGVVCEPAAAARGPYGSCAQDPWPASVAPVVASD